MCQILYQVLDIWKVKAASTPISLQFCDINKGVPHSRKWHRIGCMFQGFRKGIYCFRCVSRKVYGELDFDLGPKGWVELGHMILRMRKWMEYKLLKQREWNKRDPWIVWCVPRKPELKEAHVPQCSSQHCL